MNQRPLLLLIYAATSAPGFAQDKPAADLPQLVAAGEENIRATQRALAREVKPEGQSVNLAVLGQQTSCDSMSALSLRP